MINSIYTNVFKRVSIFNEPLKQITNVHIYLHILMFYLLLCLTLNKTYQGILSVMLFTFQIIFISFRKYWKHYINRAMIIKVILVEVVPIYPFTVHVTR